MPSKVSGAGGRGLVFALLFLSLLPGVAFFAVPTPDSSPAARPLPDPPPDSGRRPEEATDAGLRWLARNQEPDGRWDAAKHGASIRGSAPHLLENPRVGLDVGVTGLAALAFMSDGHTSNNGEHRETVRRAMEWLAKQQNGRTGRWPGSHYSHALAAFAATESFGMDNSRQAMAQKGLDYLVSTQGDAGGWNYYPDRLGGKSRSNASITIWCLLALKSGKMADLRVPDDAFGKVKSFYRRAADATGVAYEIGRNPDGTTHFQKGGGALKAAATVGLLLLGTPPTHPVIRMGEGRTVEEGPQVRNLYHAHFQTLALFQMGTPAWGKWHNSCHPSVAQREVAEGREDGSWEPGYDAYGSEGGRVYTTAMAILILETYYRGYMPIYR